MLIQPSSEPGTMSFWHGGKLDFYSEVTYKKGRWEYGPGLYLTTNYSVAKKYSGGGRLLYMITIKKGTDIADVSISVADLHEFISDFVIKKYQKDCKDRFAELSKNDAVAARLVQNVFVNNEWLKTSNVNELNKFLKNHGVDYSMMSRTFGFDSSMCVLYNTKLIVSTKVISSKDKIEMFDLPNNFQ
jgi:hypothetical protein